jgi:hypothetical protein
MSMMLDSPTFLDESGYFVGMNIDTEFYALDEGLKLIRQSLGEEKYLALTEMSARMKAHFEADPNDENGECLAGRELILDMIDILKGRKSTDAAKG